MSLLKKIATFDFYSLSLLLLRFPFLISLWQSSQLYILANLQSNNISAPGPARFNIKLSYKP